jgi:hypothetical protein
MQYRLLGVPGYLNWFFEILLRRNFFIIARLILKILISWKLLPYWLLYTIKSPYNLQ